MTLVQAAYHLLFLLSIVDGNHEESETKSIIDYLRKKKGETEANFDIDAENEFLANLSDDDLADHFETAAKAFLLVSSEDDRSEFLLHAMSLIMSDRHVAIEEKITIRALAEYWGIDFQQFVKEVRSMTNQRGNQSLN